MVAIGIMAVVYLATTQILVRVQLSHATMVSTMALRQEARVLLMRMGDEVRGAGHGLVGSLEGISHASTRQLTVALDLDRGSSDRPYREGMPIASVMGIIREGSGSHFDAVVAEALDGLVAEDAEFFHQLHRAA